MAFLQRNLPVFNPGTHQMDAIIAETLALGNREIKDFALEIRDRENDERVERDQRFFTLGEMIYKVKHPRLSMSDIVTVIEAAPDEEAQLQTVMARLSKKGEYDALLVELAIATIDPHDTDAIIDFVAPLDVQNIKYIKAASGKTLFECTSCEEHFSAKDLVTTTCGHCYCGSCLGVVFNAALNDESLYPPRCCRNLPISIEHAKKFLDPEFEEKFKEKGVEFGTVDRTYCSDPTCSTFLPPETIDRANAYCEICGNRTCVVCKAPGHEGDCPTDHELAALLKYAEEMHWQRCFDCLSVVQKQDGCDHMECRCGAEFCYTCGRPVYNHDDGPCPCQSISPLPYRFYRPSTNDSKSAESLSRTSEAADEVVSVLSAEIQNDSDHYESSNDEFALSAVQESFGHVAPPNEAVEQLSNDIVPTEDNDDNEVMGFDGRPELGRFISSIARMEMLIKTRTTIVEHSEDQSSPSRDQQPTLSDRFTVTRLGLHRTLRARLGPHRRLQNQ